MADRNVRFKMQKLAEILVFQVDVTRDDVLAAGWVNTSSPLTVH